MTPTERMEQTIADARNRVHEMDNMDHVAGFATPADCPWLLTLRTGIEAVKAGLATESWACTAEGAVILLDLEERMRTAWDAGFRPT